MVAVWLWRDLLPSQERQLPHLQWAIQGQVLPFMWILSTLSLLNGLLLFTLENDDFQAPADDEDDDDVDLFGEETEEEKKAAEERAAAVKSSAKKKECEFPVQVFVVPSISFHLLLLYVLTNVL